MIFDHLTLPVHDLERSIAFYARALAPLGISIVAKFEGIAGLGRDGRGALWLRRSEQVQPLHVAFAADRRTQVDDFHSAALAAGARDNGAPGVRANYHPHYYGAFVIDPDGHNIEAVCHQAC